MLFDQLPPDWRDALPGVFSQPSSAALERFLRDEREHHTVFPAPQETFRALELTPLAEVRAVILGQDPYPTPGHAHGLAFSVRPGVPPPRSLANMFRELEADLGHPPASTGSLEAWGGQGVLLLNTVLTVRSGAAGSHARRGWEPITDAMIGAVARLPDPVVFCLWGNAAQAKQELIPPGLHTVLRSAHPSPLSARKGFFGSRPYSRINGVLRSAGRGEINWRL